MSQQARRDDQARRQRASAAAVVAASQDRYRALIGEAEFELLTALPSAGSQHQTGLLLHEGTYEPDVRELGNDLFQRGSRLLIKGGQP